MKSDLPFIHLFRNMNKYFFYDVNKHKTVNISKEVYELLQKQNQTSELSKHPFIEKLKESNFLSSNRVQSVIHPNDKLLEDLLNNKLNKINLQVTQQCNFRCSYCVYSGGYENREHANKRMEWATAKKGIDFLLNHSKDSNRINISFFGGEPLLEIGLILKCMKYVTDVTEGKKVNYSITTNGSLLNENVITNLLKYDVNIGVSLDGPKEIHDKNRKFAANGCGTFDSVFNNIKNLVIKFPELKRKLLFSMVIDPTIQLNCLNEFIITEEELFKESGIMSAFINENYKKEGVVFNRDFIKEWEYNRFRYFLHLFGKISDKNNSQLMRSSCNGLFDYIANIKKSYPPLNKEEHHAGPCIPGQIRLFMNVDGIFYPCERVCETSEIMKIGNINDGFDFVKIKELLNVGKVTEENCKNCFAFRGCTICAAMADDANSNTFSKELKMSACKNIKHNYEEMLKDACTFKDLGFNSNILQVNNIN